MDIKSCDYAPGHNGQWIVVTVGSHWVTPLGHSPRRALYPSCRSEPTGGWLVGAE